MKKRLMHAVGAILVLIVSAAALSAQIVGEGPLPTNPDGSLPGGAPTFVRPETAEQRLARIGTTEDPGINPDPNKVFKRFGKDYHIHRYPRRFSKFHETEANMIRPITHVNVYRELYQMNDHYIWVWEMTLEQAQRDVEEFIAREQDLQKSTLSASRFSDEQIEFFQAIRSEFTSLTPPKSSATLRFEESSDGLPRGGSWRNSLDIADMNGDGHLDLVAPPERGAGGRPVPAIFLGDGNGKWSEWSPVSWPQSYDYGSVATGDFNGDGIMDVALGVHLRGLYVAAGDGKGTFQAITEDLPQDFPSRRIRVADMDRDGAPDIIALNEGPGAIHSNSRFQPKLRVYLNRNKGTAWERVDVVSPQARVAGDWLTVGNFNSDRYPDLLASAIYFGSTETLYLSKAAKEWVQPGNPKSMLVPAQSLYFGTAAGKFSSRRLDDAVLSFVRSWPNGLNPELVPAPEHQQVVGLERISFSGSEPRRHPIMRWAGGGAVKALAAADINGDGLEDLLFARDEPREFVALLGNGRGGFEVAEIDGLPYLPHSTYDLRLADVNRDGRVDVIVMYEADETASFAPKNGSVRVYLNRTAPPAPARRRAAG